MRWGVKKIWPKKLSLKIPPDFNNINIIGCDIIVNYPSKTQGMKIKRIQICALPKNMCCFIQNAQECIFCKHVVFVFFYSLLMWDARSGSLIVQILIPFPFIIWMSISVFPPHSVIGMQVCSLTYSCRFNSFSNLQVSKYTLWDLVILTNHRRELSYLLCSDWSIRWLKEKEKEEENSHVLTPSPR